MDREPYAYWKGNPAVAETRQELMKCNVSDNQDWNARVYAQVTFLNFVLYICIECKLNNRASTRRKG